MTPYAFYLRYVLANNEALVSVPVPDGDHLNKALAEAPNGAHSFALCFYDPKADWVIVATFLREYEKPTNVH